MVGVGGRTTGRPLGRPTFLKGALMNIANRSGEIAVVLLGSTAAACAMPDIFSTAVISALWGATVGIFWRKNLRRLKFRS
jgi:hypothetical protein